MFTKDFIYASTDNTPVRIHSHTVALPAELWPTTKYCLISY